MASFRLRRPARPNVLNPARVRGRRNALTAAGYRIRARNADTSRRLIQAWHARSFAYYDQVPEIKYAAQFYSRLLSPLRLYAAERDDAGEVTETAAPEAIEALDRIRDPGGGSGRSNLLGSYGRLMFLVGESILFVSPDPDTDTERWEMLSTDELRIQGGTYLRYRAPSLPAEQYYEIPEPEDDPASWQVIDAQGEDGRRRAAAYRLWRRHPRFSWLSDATMQGALDIAEELVLLTQGVRARVRSRLAGSGLLLIPDGLTTVPLEAAPTDDPLVDPFLAELVNAMTAPIVDEGTAAAVVPLVIRGQGDQLEKVRHVQIVDPTQLYPETGLRRECVQRLAIGLDMPPEQLLGLSSTNHWSGWMIDDQTWRAHGQLIADGLVDDLTSAYLLPYLKALGVRDWGRYCVAYDATAVINHPDRGKDAKDLFDRVVIGGRALRDATGFADEDAPTEQERAERIGILTRDSSLAWDGIPSVKAGGLEPEPGVIVQAGQPTGGTPVGPSVGAEVVPGPPSSGPPDGNEGPPTSIVGSNGHGQAVAWRIVGAADLAVARARELAGNQLWNACRRDRTLIAELEGVPRRDVAAVLGADRVAALGRGSARTLAAQARPWIIDALRLYGLDDQVAGRLVTMIEQHVAQTLFDRQPPPLPQSFLNYVQGVTVQIGTRP